MPINKADTTNRPARAGMIPPVFGQTRPTPIVRLCLILGAVMQVDALASDWRFATNRG
jgi:hypothetical protein